MEALQTSFSSSAGVTSAIERKCRGVEDEADRFGGVELECDRREALASCCRADFAVRKCVKAGILRC